MKSNSIEIYTDGSCHTQLKTGAWAAILLDGEKTILTGIELNTTHNRMEIQAVLRALKYVSKNPSNYDSVKVFSDSQYVVDIQMRKDKLIDNQFLTKKGLPIQNADLVKALIEYMEELPMEIIKVKAHQKESSNKNYNREVDKLVRKLLRDEVKNF